MTDILVIPDPHAHPDYDNDRFALAGRYIGHTRPDIVVCMGDWGDYSSLCKHSAKKERETKRVKRDKEAHVDSLRVLESGIREGCRIHRKRYQPERHYILGNHDVRPFAIASDMPELEGIFDDLFDPWVETGWRIHDFKEVVDIRGIAFSHVLPSGNMGRPVGGVTLGRSLVVKGHGSAVVGHDHRFSHGKEETWLKKKLHGFSAGCFAHPDYIEDWCRNTRHMWDLGLLRLRGVENGTLDGFSWMSMDELEEKYG